MSPRRPRLLFLLSIALASALAAPGCHFDTGYIAAAEVGSPDPIECPQEGGASIVTRLVQMSAAFVPEAGTTDYAVVFSFQPTGATAGSLRHIRAPEGALGGDAGGLRVTYYTCVLQGTYEVTAAAVRRTPPDSAPTFNSTCDGQVTTTPTSVVIEQTVPFGPVSFGSCLEP